MLGVVEHIVKSTPASATACALIVKVFVEVAFAHGAFPVAVNVNVTLPAVISAALGA